MEDKDSMQESWLVCRKCGEKHLKPIFCSFITGYAKFKCKKCLFVNIYPMRKRVLNSYIWICIFIVLMAKIPGLIFLFIFIKNKLIWKSLTEEQKAIFWAWDKITPKQKWFSQYYTSW